MTQADDGRTAGLPELPSGWCWTTLEAVADIEGGITKDQNRRRTGAAREVPYLRVANVQRGYLDLSELKTILADQDEIQHLRLQPGDVLFTEGGDRDKLGRGWVWSGEIDECIHQNHIFRARPNRAAIEPKFISLHGNHFGQEWFARTGKQTTNLASINKGILRKFPVPVAPLNEQRRIVAKVDELFSDLDFAVAALKRAQASLKKYRAAVLKAAVTGELTAEWRAAHPNTEPATKLLERIIAERRQDWEEQQLAKFAAHKEMPSKRWQLKYQAPMPVDSGDLATLPAGWCWARVNQVGHVQLGRQRSPKHHQGTHMRPYLRVANVFENRIDASDVLRMNFTPNDYETYRLTCGDILLNEGQSLHLVGRAAMYRGEVPGACFQNTLVRFRAARGLLPEFALYVFLAYLHNKRFQKLARWTVNIAHLGADRFSNIEFPLPPLDEQRAIVLEVEQQLSEIEATKDYVEASVKRADRLRQSILREALAGRLVPQDPSDEPASALLDRIRQARADANGSAAKSPAQPRARSRPSPKRQSTLFEDSADAAD